jgi:hypothetical protein
MWVIPAKVEGTWKLSQGDLSIRQEYQMIYGTYKNGTKTSTISEGRLDGNNITFKIDGQTYKGVVSENKTIKGTVLSNSTTSAWTAMRAGD